MNKIRIQATVPSLTQLNPVGLNTYGFWVHFLDSSNNPIVNSNLPSTPYYATANTTSTTFNIDVPIQEQTFSLDDVNIVVYSNEDDNVCCNDSIVTDIESVIISNEAVLLNSLSTGEIYRYEPSTEALLNIFTGVTSPDIAHTPTRMWIYNTVTVSGTPYIRLYQYIITLNPFSITASNTFDLPFSTGGAGLCAVSNTELYMAGTNVTRINISGGTATTTLMFLIPNLYQCTGDLIYDPATQLFLMAYHNTNIPSYRIGIFTSTGTVVRFATAPVNDIFGIYQFEGVTYVISGSGQVYSLDLTTLATTPVDTIPVNLAGASQIQSNISIPA